MWFTLILFVVSIVLNELLRPKPPIEDARPKGLGDFQFPTATEGRVVPLVFGRVRLRGPNVVWYGDLEQSPLSKFFKSGLWSGKRAITGFQYHMGVQLALCRGPNVVLKRVWIGDVEVYSGTVSADGSTFDIDKPELFGGEEYGSGGVQARCEYYSGSLTQAVSSYLNSTGRQLIPTAATPTAPSYVGTCYILCRWLPTDTKTGVHDGCYLGNSTSIKPWSFEVERYPDTFAGQSGGQNKVNSIDCNPINVIYELLTNDEWGFGFPASDIDVGTASSFKTASDTVIAEGNGFSMVIDRQMKAKDLLQEIQRQVDGAVFIDQRTGKWTIKLARTDYDIDTVFQATDANVREVKDFTRGSWEDTSNQVQVQYTNRGDDYKPSYGIAQDMANAIIQGNGTTIGAVIIGAQASYPGVMTGKLASQLAWRDVRAQSYPLARVTLVMDRTAWAVTIGDVIAWTNPALGFTKLPLRVNRVDFGRMDANEMELQCVQDVFQFAEASYGDAPDTEWTLPTFGLSAYPVDQQLAIEAPRAIIVRDPYRSPYADPGTRILCAARRQGSEVAFSINHRSAAGTPSGAYVYDGDVTAFMRIGQLATGLVAGESSPTASITIAPGPDIQDILLALASDVAVDYYLGIELRHLILVGNEFMLFKNAVATGSNVALERVFRGMLDSAQQKHDAGDPVYLVYVGANLNDSDFTPTHNVDVELRPVSPQTTFSGTVNTISLTLQNRVQRPYPPSLINYGGAGWAIPSAEGAGSGLNGLGFNVGWWRRKFTTTNEVLSVTADENPDSPTSYTTQYRVRVFVDPDGVNTEIDAGPSTWASGIGPVFVNRLQLWNIAPAGTKISVQVETRHTIDAATLTALYPQTHHVVPTSTNDGRFYLGGNLSASSPTNAYTATNTGTYTVAIGAAYSTSVVQYRLNGGAWNTAVAAGATTGNVPGVTAGDTIELRHTVNQAPDPQYVELRNPAASPVAYGTFSA